MYMKHKRLVVWQIHTVGHFEIVCKLKQKSYVIIFHAEICPLFHKLDHL